MSAKTTTNSAVPLGAAIQGEWYLADLVMSIGATGDDEVLVHINTYLIAAGDAAEAHDKALRLGQRESSSWQNDAGEVVTMRCLGVRELTRIHEELADGSEIRFVEIEGQTPGQAAALVRPIDELAAMREAGR